MIEKIFVVLGVCALVPPTLIGLIQCCRIAFLCSTRGDTTALHLEARNALDNTALCFFCGKRPARGACAVVVIGQAGGLMPGSTRRYVYRDMVELIARCGPCAERHDRVERAGSWARWLTLLLLLAAAPLTQSEVWSWLVWLPVPVILIAGFVARYITMFFEWATAERGYPAWRSGPAVKALRDAGYGGYGADMRSNAPRRLAFWGSHARMLASRWHGMVLVISLVLATIVLWAQFAPSGGQRRYPHRTRHGSLATRLDSLISMTGRSYSRAAPRGSAGIAPSPPMEDDCTTGPLCLAEPHS